jgi:hypothetical protein
MNARRRSADGGSFYESFSDLIFLTLIVFVVLVLALVLRLREAQDAVTAQLTEARAGAAERAGEVRRLTAEVRDLTKRLAASDGEVRRSALLAQGLAQDLEMARNEVAQPAAARPTEPVPDRRPTVFSGVFMQPNPAATAEAGQPFRFQASSRVLGTFTHATSRFSYHLRIGGDVSPSAWAAPVSGADLQAMLAMLAYDDDPRAPPAPMLLQFLGNLMPTADGLDYAADAAETLWCEGSMRLDESPVRFVWGRAVRDGSVWRRFAGRHTVWSGVARGVSPVAGWIRVGEVIDPGTGEPPERPLRLRVDRRTDATIGFRGQELSLRVLAVLLGCNSGRPVVLPDGIAQALGRLRG